MPTPQVQRLIHLLRLLGSGRRMNVAAFAKKLGTSDRTVFRDLEALRSAGIAMRFNAAENTYELEHDVFISPVDLTLRECLSLLIRTRSRLAENLTPDEDAAASAAPTGNA